MATRLFSMLVAALFVGGCGIAPRRSSSGALPGATGALDYLDPDSERRAEAHARYANGVLFDLDGRPREAAEEFHTAALADSGNERLVLEVSKRLLQEKMYLEAVELLEKATAGPKSSGVLSARLGLAYALNGESEQAIRANRQAIVKEPRDLQGYRHLAQLHLQEGRTAEAFEVLDEAASQLEVPPPYLVELAELYLSFGKVSGIEPDRWKPQALAVLDRAREHGAKNPILIQKMAESYYVAGREETAQQLYVELLELLPDVPGVREKLIEIYLRKQETERALPLLEKLVNDNPTNPQAHYFLGAIALERRRLETAVDHLGKAILLNPDLEPAYYDLAGALISLDKPGKALETMEAARRRFQQKFALEYYTAIAYNRLQDHASALSHFISAEVIARATEPERLTHTFYFQLGAVSERNQQFEEAERYFRKCLEADPEFSEALNYLGYMWAERDTNLQEARELIEKALALDPDNAAYLDSLGWVLFKLEEYEQALHYIELAIDKSERPDPTLLDHLGDILLKLNEVDKACQAWKKSLELEPNDTIQKKLETAPESPKT